MMAAQQDWTVAPAQEGSSSAAATIRPAVLGDEEELTALNDVVHRIHVQNQPRVFKTADLREVTRWFKSLLKNPRMKLWLAEAGRTSVGYISSSLRDTPATPFCLPRQLLWIEQVSVLPAWQRRGVGRALLERALDHARASGVTEVELASWCFNEPAQQSFRRLGFQPQVVHFALKLERR
jgi:ribosomal protein S18 acetylase RimI-like enzyme